MMGYAHFLLASGYSVAMMDARAHGDSGGTISTYGHIERYDVSATLDALTASENVDHAYAFGESMGAAVALQAAEVDPRIEAVVAEGAFRNLHEVMFDYAGLRWSALLENWCFVPLRFLQYTRQSNRADSVLSDVSPES